MHILCGLYLRLSDPLGDSSSGHHITIKAEYTALSMIMGDLIPLKTAIREIADGVGLNSKKIVMIKKSIWEDNVGALTPVSMELPLVTPMSKYYASTYNWFRSFVDDDGDGGCEVVKIVSADQVADILAKALIREEPFQRNLKSCSWVGNHGLTFMRERERRRVLIVSAYKIHSHI
jgi:hypothetical protein